MRTLRRAALACTALGVLVACGATRAYTSDPGPYDRVPDGWAGTLREARQRFDRGDPARARELLEPLAREHPRILPVRILLQEVELALLEREGRLGELGPVVPGQVVAVLAERYAAEAAARPAPEGLVLAARLAEDGNSALELLAGAEALDPSCVWVNYGRAWWLQASLRFREAREEVRKALRRDGGHLPTLRLHAAMLAGSGEFDEAFGALETWLERTADDPLHSSRDRADALLDLAALEVLRERPKQALELLEKLDPRALRDPARAEEVRAAALEARGEYADALGAVHRANRLAPREALPLVQEAMLLSSVGDLAGEKAVWERLLERTRARTPATDPRNPTGIDFEALLFRVQAHARIERIERELR